jgi:GNAT superfamily N-acetyltransferase
VPDPRCDREIDPLVAVAEALARQDPDRHATGRLGSARGGGHHLAEAACDDDTAPLGQQAPHLLGTLFVLGATADHRHLSRAHAPMVERRAVTADRCIAFLRDHAYRISEQGPSRRFGTALLRDDLRDVWSANYLLAERELGQATAEELIREAEELLGGAGLRHRKIEVLDGEAGGRLAPEFRRLGWHVEHDLVMPHRRPSDREIDVSHVEEVDTETLAPTWAEGMRGDFAGREDVVEQLVEHKRLLADAGARFFAVRANGTVASYCDLYSDGRTAQIEAVMTLERFRNRGLARAVVMGAVAAAREQGNELVFLLADEADWPKRLYEKLGFVAEGDVYEFTLRAASPV